MTNIDDGRAFQTTNNVYALNTSPPASIHRKLELHEKYSEIVQIPAKAIDDFLTVTLRYRSRI